MKRAILLLIPLLAACSGGGSEGGNRAPSGGGEPVQTEDLTGLYQGAVRMGAGEGARMCMVADGPDETSFGIVTERLDGGTCSGFGNATREGDVLRLTMSGDEECLIDARMTGTQVSFPATLPDSCAYYCSEGATLAGESFEKTGGTADDAMRATDLAGDPLCA